MVDLRKISLFSTVTDPQLKEILSYFTQISVKKRETIFSEGDPSDWLLIVAEGKVKITKLSMDGKEIILEVIQPLDFFGAIAVLKGFPYPANAIAMEDSKLLKISRTNLMRVLDRFPHLMNCITSQLGERLKQSHESLKNIALERVESRIASLLLKLSDKAGEKVSAGILVGMRLTKQDIAEMVGTTVETSIRTMSKFKKLGIISEKEGKVLIKNIEKLRSL
ncbi:MAG: Crp/Fnr family transcriptional regulator [Thermodesulfovibrionales bacterium]|jgi:CRP/FNR family transcriptional regulator